MKPVANQARQRRAFTIIELLTVMSIIVILIGLMVPALNKVRRYAMDVRQKAQFNAMNTALELFHNEYGGYPPSDALDPQDQPYVGAMKLCEALMGQDLLGFHSNSVFRRDGLGAAGNVDLYPDNVDSMDANLRDNNLKARKGPYIQAENANAFRMEDIYAADIGSFLPTTFVLCDVYERQMRSGEKTGMPILYYKADTANDFHNANLVGNMTPRENQGNIYNYWDNQELIQLGKPWQSSGSAEGHRMAEPERFYKNTQSDKVTTTSRPFRADTFLLISAGFDSEYGTADDICNYDWNYKE